MLEAITASGGVLVWSGGTITGSGTLIGNVQNEGLIDFDGLIVGTMSISNGGRLEGGPTITGDVTIGNGIVSPGHVVMGASGTFAFTMSDASGAANQAAGWDPIDVNGPLTISATPSEPFVVALESIAVDGNPAPVVGFDPTRSYSWVFASADSISGFDPAAFLLDTSGFLNTTAGEFFLSQSGSSLILSYQAVPEPSSFVLLAMGVAGFTLLNRHRKIT